MGFIIAGVVVLINILGSFKKSRLFIFIAIFFMWILYGWNVRNPDYFNYMNMFNQVKLNLSFALVGKDIGYRVLMSLFSYVGIDYQGFIVIVSIFGLLLIASTVKKYSPNNSYVYLLYFIFPFFLDVVQARNFLMMAIIVYSVRYMIEEKKNHKIKFIILYLIAFSMHSAAILYLPLIFLKKNSKNTLIKFFVFISMIFSLITFLNGNKIPFIQQFISIFTNNNYILSWFDNATNYGFLLFWGMQCLSFFIVRFSRKLVHNSENTLNSKYVQFVDLVYWINFIAFMWFPFYMVSIEFTRLMRNLFILNYIVFSIANKVFVDSGKTNKLIYNLFIFIYALFFFLIQIYLPHSETVLQSILKYNYFW